MITACLGAVAYAYSSNYQQNPQLTLNLNAGEIAEITFTYTCGGKQYGDITTGVDPGYKWKYSVVAGDITFLSFPAGDWQFIGYVDNCLMTTVQVSSLIQCNTTGTVTLGVAGDIPRTCFVDSNWCMLGKVIAKSF